VNEPHKPGVKLLLAICNIRKETFSCPWDHRYGGPHVVVKIIKEKSVLVKKKFSLQIISTIQKIVGGEFIWGKILL
jgi:hypothetical protein